MTVLVAFGVANGHLSVVPCEVVGVVVVVSWSLDCGDLQSISRRLLQYGTPKYLSSFDFFVHARG
jgi:hypothetical protein